MRTNAVGWRVIGAVTATLVVLWAHAEVLAQATPHVATPAPPATVGELGALVEQAPPPFRGRGAAGGARVTKPALREQLLALYSLYDAVRARIQVDQVQLVDGDAWVYTTGEVSGRLPIVGGVTVLSWQREPEVARRQGAAWRLIGFQD